MCPSIRCPNCNLFTYHRGVCENDSCRFNPTDCDESKLNLGQIPGIVNRREFSLVSIRSVPKPFPFIRFTAKQRMSITALAEAFGYTGPIFYTPKDADDFLAEPAYGFDLVKHLTDGIFPLVKGAAPAA